MEDGRPLAERLRETIRREGPLRFDRFQRVALYDPEGGYYERPGRVGPEGDFVTGASWHPAFARCLARVASRLVEERTPPLDIVDVGAGEGELLGFLTEALGGDERFRLLGVEASETRRRQAARRAPLARLVKDVGELPPRLCGLVVAYELLDALPVRALRAGTGGVLLERAVALDAEGGFSWMEVPCPDGGELLAALGRRGVTLEEGQLLELRPGATELARSLAERLAAGLLLVFDYGAPARALYAPLRRNGTLEAFQRQGVTRDVLSEPGSRDITAWVDFTELQEALTASGLAVFGLVSQSRFLLAAGIADELARDDLERPPTAERAVELNAIAKLFMPGGMGESIRVLVAGRGTSLGETLVRFPAP